MHQEPLYRRFYAPLCSTACAYTVFFAFVLIVLPVIIAYNSYDFWLKDDYYLEQPKLTYQYLTNFQCYGTSGDGSSLNLQYSTNAYINQLYPSTRMPIFRSAELDDDRDGTIERLELSILLPLQVGEAIHGFTTLIYYDARLNSRAKLLFDAAAFVNFEGSTALSKVALDGDMLLRQTWPLPVYGGYRRWYEDDPLFDITSSTSVKDVSMQHIMQRYNARNGN